MDFFRRSNPVEGEVSVDTSTEDSGSGPRESIRARLTSSIKDLQAEYGEGNLSGPIETNELTHALMMAIESIFIHGLKGQPTKAVKASSHHRPNPSFWLFALVFTHKETINSIEKLSAIRTDVGRGRVWIRMALNEGSLCSYLESMSKETVTLRRHYHRHSIFRDPDTMEIFIRYLRGIEIYQFDIALNSGLLNRWATGPLILAGICLPDSNSSSSSSNATTATSAAVVAVDAAAMLEDEDPLAASTPATTSDTEIINKPAGYLNRGLLNEDEAIRFILAGVSPVVFSGASSSTNSPPVNNRVPNPKSAKNPFHDDEEPVDVQQQQTSSSSEEVMISGIPEEPQALAATTATISSISDNNMFDRSLPQTPPILEAQPTPSSVQNDLEEDEDDEELVDIYYRRRESSSSERVMETSTTSMTLDEEDTSINKPVTSAPIISAAAAVTSSVSYVAKKGYGLSSSRSSGSDSSVTLASVPCLSGFIDSWHPFGSGRYFDTPPKQDETSYGFTLKPSVQVGSLSQEDSQQLMVIFDQIVREEGLDVQNYECAECTRAIGTIFGPAKLCSYTRRYYCQECHTDELSTIPAKIMYNWDFRQFRVCHKAKLFLTAVSIEPIIDVKSFNGELFNFATSLNEVFDLRRQLRYMNAYLATCADGKSRAKATFERMLWPRQYLYEQVDMYSIRDLEEIHTGHLVSLLHSVAKFSLKHILKCILCAGKGYICEICRADQVIFPFELDSIMQCKQCFTVFHLDCSLTMTTCPKCDRIEARHLNWQVSLSKSQRLHNNHLASPEEAQEATEP